MVAIPKDKLFSPYKSFGEVKADGTRKIEGLGIRFTDVSQKDSYGEFFTELTETGLQNGDTRPFLYEHWQDEILSWQIVGRAVYEKSGDGWAYQATLFDNTAGNIAYEKIAAEPHYSSTGSGWNYTKGTYVDGYSAYRLDTWLVIEQSATKRPADFWNPPVSIKSFAGKENLLAIVQPLLADWGKSLLEFEAQRLEFEKLKSQIVQVETAVAGLQPKGVQLPADIQALFESVQKQAKSIK